MCGPNRRDLSKIISNSLRNSCNGTPNDQVCDDDHLRTLFLHDWYSSKNVQVSDSSGPSQNYKAHSFHKRGVLGLQTKEVKRSQTFINSMLLCFGAGVLLATALLHILPETRHGME